MTTFVPSPGSDTDAILIVEFAEYLTGKPRKVGFLVDADLVEGLRILGNWHPRVKQAPERYAPVLRRKDSRSGRPREVRLPVAVVTLRQSGDPIGVAGDFHRFLDLTRFTKVERLPANQTQRDCRYENWVPRVATIEGVDLPDFNPSELDDQGVVKKELTLDQINELRLRHGFPAWESLPGGVEKSPEAENRAEETRKSDEGVDRLLNMMKNAPRNPA